MGVAALFLLSCICLFAITAKAQQCSKPTGGPNMDLKPEFITNTTFADGSTVAFSCNPGYAPAGGSATITCTAGLWSEVQLRCERKNCGALPEVANGHITYINGTEFGDTAKVTCNLGYNPVGGSAVIRCEVEGWTGRLPTCEVVQCVTPGGIVNGTFSPVKDSYDYREVVRYSCNKDLELNGSRESTCSEDGNFSPAPPNCVWVECKDPVIENAEFQSGSRPPHRFNAVVTYSCKPGYTMEGLSTVTCNLTSQWSPSLPKCNKSHEAGASLLRSVGGVHPGQICYFQNNYYLYYLQPPEGDLQLTELKNFCSAVAFHIGTVTDKTEIPDPTQPTTTTVSRTTGTTATTTTSPSGNGDSLSPGIIALIVIVSIIVFAVCVICAVYCYRKKRKQRCPVDAKLQHVKVSS